MRRRDLRRTYHSGASAIAAPAPSAASGMRLPVASVTAAKPARNMAIERCSSPAAPHLSAADSSRRSADCFSRSLSSSPAAIRPRTSPAAWISMGREERRAAAGPGRPATRRTAAAASRRSIQAETAR